jgi:hypothetical protein
MVNNAELVAPCGMNCGICSNYLAGTRDIKTRGVRMPYCRGCRPRNKPCAFLKKRCHLLREGRVKFCSGCPDVPCEPLKTLDKRYRERYHMSMLENLAFIQDHGFDAFLGKEERKWRCPDCGGTISCHNGICFDCGVERLRSRTTTKGGLYRWEENYDKTRFPSPGTGSTGEVP